MIHGYDSPGNCHEASLGPSLAEVCNAAPFVVFMSLLNSCVRTNQKISGICKRVKSVRRPDNEYDFVIIGGGAGGVPVAARLSEIPKWKVLLLEAGPDEPAGTRIPSFHHTYLTTRLAWDYASANESHACLTTNGTCLWPSPKCLGGGTAYNAMMYIRGNPTDYNNWAALGNEGWTWEEVRKYFLKAEDNGEIHRVGRVHHATGGPQDVERFPYFPEIGYSFLAAAEEAGFGISEDLNGDKLTGFSVTQATVKNGVRVSSASAYLRPIRHRKNLHVSLKTFATRLIIKNKKAIGVEYYKNGEFNTVYVTKEVIVSAGAIKSPHILLVSGIGPKKHLESKGVAVVKDLPGVGENFHDHVNTIMWFTIKEPDIYDNNYIVATQYLANQTGPMSAIGLSQVVGILASNQTTPDHPDIQIFLGGYQAACAPGDVNALQSTGKRTIAILPTYLHPKSKGRVSLASKDPFEYPVLWANYMGEASDVKGVVDAMKMTLALLRTKALHRYKLALVATYYAACSGYQFLSDEWLACAAQQITYALYHHVGSCKMGPASDPMAVVDPQLRVYGIKGLRVADASIMPEVPSGNTANPTMMIGERAADFIKRDWQRRLGKKTEISRFSDSF